MKYFIGYLIQGEAAQWYVKFTKNISDRFDTWKIYEKIPPHITIFQPFDIDNIESILNLLNTWSKSQEIRGNIVISGFDRFDDRIIFAKVASNSSISIAVRNLKKQLQAIPKMPEEDYPRWHPHVTLADRLDSEKIVAIWKYISILEVPNFILPFNNIALFSYSGDKVWQVDKLFTLKLADRDVEK